MGNFAAPMGAQQMQPAPQINPFIAALFNAGNQAGAFNQPMRQQQQMGGFGQHANNAAYWQPQQPAFSGPNAGWMNQLASLGAQGTGNVQGTADIAKSLAGDVGGDWFGNVQKALSGAQDFGQFQTLQQMFRNQLGGGQNNEALQNQLNGLQYGAPTLEGTGMIKDPVHPFQSGIMQQQPGATMANMPQPFAKVLGGNAGQNPFVPRRNKFGNGYL